MEDHQFRKINLVGAVFSIVSGQNYGHIYIQIYIYIYVRFIHWMCGVFGSFDDTAHTRRHIPIEGSVVGKGGVAISQHTAVLLGGGESRCPRWFCRRRCDVLV